MHTKIIEREKFLVLSTAEDNFEAEMVLLASIQDDLFWWRNVFFDLSQHNVTRSGQFAPEIFTDASLTGSGAVCDDSRTHGFWSTNNKEYHINFLELLAIFYALKCFASHLKSCDILLRVDNCTFLCQLYGLNQIPSFI